MYILGVVTHVLCKSSLFDADAILISYAVYDSVGNTDRDVFYRASEHSKLCMLYVFRQLYKKVLQNGYLSNTTYVLWPYRFFKILPQ